MTLNLAPQATKHVRRIFGVPPGTALLHWQRFPIEFNRAGRFAAVFEYNIRFVRIQRWWHGLESEQIENHRQVKPSNVLT
jgi:hypothetical protein